MAHIDGAAPVSSENSGAIHIAPVSELVDFDQCVALQGAVWGYSDGDLIPRRVFLVARQIGGQVIGAFDGDALVGFAMALPGYRDGGAYLHSHMLAVLPAYRNRGLGRRLKLAQREDALSRGFDLMEWTFDPLEIKNAHLNIERLGAIARHYLPNFYGPSTSPLQGGLPTDRLVAEWWLQSPRVLAAIREASEETVERIVTTAQNLVQVQVPKEVAGWKQSPAQRNLAAALQSLNRAKLETAFAQGLAVTGYMRTTEGDGCFVIGELPALQGKK